MRITRLQVRDVRRYRDLDINLAPGLTVIRGANEAGKSTIQRAIELALTRKVTSTHADLDALRPMGRRPRLPAGHLASSSSRRMSTARGSGTLEKAFRAGKGSVSLRVDGETTTDPSRADELLAEMTGVPTEAFFRSTASIRHHELARRHTRRRGAARPPPGVDQRRRSRDVRGQEEARSRR